MIVIIKNGIMKTLQQIIIFFLILINTGCNVSQQPIDYGNEACHFCKMTIVDKQHASEIVTKKGKAYKFDSTECMIHFLDDFDTTPIALYLSNDYTKPEVLINARNATFLISDQIPSPMGANLSAFKNNDEAVKIQNIKGGNLYEWEELLNHFKLLENVSNIR